MDHYETLGIAHDASPGEVKKAYRRMASEHHPDRHGGDDAKMQDVNRAYACLSDPARRATYDATGQDTDAETLENLVRKEVLGLFAAVVESFEGDSLFDYARRVVANRKAQFLGDKSAAAQKRRWVEKRRGRIRIKTSEADLYAQVVDMRLAQIDGELQKLAKQIELCEAVEKYLDAYEGVDDGAPTRTVTFRPWTGATIA